MDEKKQGNETPDGLAAPSAAPSAAPKLTREQQRTIDVAECGAKIDAIMSEYGVRFVVIQHMVLGPQGGPTYTYDVNIVSK